MRFDRQNLCYEFVELRLTGSQSCHSTLHRITCSIRDYRKVPMKRHFCRHLLEGAAVTRPSDELTDGGHIFDCLKGADETPFPSAPSGLPLPEALTLRINMRTTNPRGLSTKKFFPGLQTYMRIPAEFLLTRNALSRGFAPGGRTSLLAYEKGRRISLRIRNSIRASHRNELVARGDYLIT